MEVYHGTDDSAATKIVAKIDVTRGGGELGQGFYAGENIALAAAWAHGRHKGNAKVVKIDIPDTEFVKLHVKSISHLGYLRRLWQKLRKKKQTQTHLFNVDVVVAPFATISFSYQYKFESAKSETVLNSKSTKAIL